MPVRLVLDCSCFSPADFQFSAGAAEPDPAIWGSQPGRARQHPDYLGLQARRAALRRAASVFVITAEDIRRSGVTNLPKRCGSLPTCKSRK